MKTVLCMLLFVSANVAQAFVVSQNLHNDYITHLYSVTNAVIADDPISDGIKYWIPVRSNEWAEIVYKFDINSTIHNASLYTEIASFRSLSPGSESYLDVSPDGMNWYNLITNTLGNSFYVFDDSITPYVSGSDEIWIRAKLLSMNTHPTGQAFYSQFMRSWVDDSKLFLIIDVPEPSTWALCLLGFCCAYYFRFSRLL